MKKEWMKRRSVRIGLAAGALVAVVMAALWLWLPKRRPAALPHHH